MADTLFDATEYEAPARYTNPYAHVHTPGEWVQTGRAVVVYCTGCGAELGREWND